MHITNSKLGAFFFTMALSIQASAINLPEAIREALKTNSDVLAAWKKYQASQSQIEKSKSGFLPKLILSSGFGKERIKSNDHGSLNRSEVQLKASQSIFKGFETTNDYRASQFSSEARYWNWRAKSENVALNVIDAFVKVIKNEKSVLYAQAIIDTHMEIMEKIRKRIMAGLGSASDLDQIEGRLAKAEATFLQSERDLYGAQLEFKNLISKEAKDLLLPDAKHFSNKDTLSTLIKDATENHPLYKTALFELQKAESEYKKSKARLYPNFSVEVTRDLTKDADGSKVEEHKLKAMLMMNYHIYNGNFDAATIKESSYERERLAEVSKGTLKQIRLDIRTLWKNHLFYKEQINYLQKYVIASENTVKAYEKQFNLGKRSLIDLLNSKSELFDSRIKLLNIEYDYFTSYYQLLSLTGSLLESFRIAPEKLMPAS